MGNKHTDRDKSLQRECKYPTEHSVADLRAARHECKTSSSALSHRPTTTLSNSTQAGGGKESCAVYPGQAVAQRSKAQGPDLLPRVRKSSQTESPVSCPASSGATELTNRKDLRHKCKQPAMHSVADLTTARHECKPPSSALSQTYSYSQQLPPGRRWQEKSCAVYPGQAVAQISKAQGPDLLPRVRKSSQTEGPVSCPASSGAEELTNGKNCGTSASNQLCTQ